MSTASNRGSVRYSTIVVDPPWDYGRKTLNFKWRRGRPSGEGQPMLAYPSLSLQEIRSLPVGALAEEDAHLYLWTTQRFLRVSYEIAEDWGFTASVVLVWAKAPTGWNPSGGAYMNNVEFILYARRGSLQPIRREKSQWWTWPRSSHSTKPEAFLDLVESVSPGPYLEMFARRNRLGWDTWGNEALEHIEVMA